MDSNIEHKTLSFPLWYIKATCGWSSYCDVTGANHYMLSEWSVDDTETFSVGISDCVKLGLIKEFRENKNDD